MKFNNKKLIIAAVFVVALVTLSACGIQLDESRALTPENAGGWWESFLVLPLIQFVTWLTNIFGNLGVAIIIATVILRLAVMPLMLKSMKNTQKMQELNPEMERIKKKYAGKQNDRGAQMAMNQEMQALYRERGVNPMAGCLPMLVQMPMMIAFFQAFQRHPLIIASAAGGESSAYFLGMNLASVGEFPNIIFAILVAGLMFYTQNRQQKSMQANNAQAAQQAKMMNVMFLPIMALTVFGSPLAMGLYFLVGQIMMTVQSFVMKNGSGAPAF